MKKLILFFAICISSAFGQQFPSYQLFINVNGVPTAVTSTLTTGQIPPPPAILAKCVNAGIIVDCNFSGGGGGAVNTIGITTANGVSGTSSGGSDPRITVVLGDITPTSVVGTGSDPVFTLPNNPTHSGANGDLYNNGGNLTFCNGGGCSALGTGSIINITGAVTPTGCTVSGGRCVVPTNIASVTFASIPGTFNHLKLTTACESSGSGGQNVDAQFNGDTGLHYIWQQIFSFGTTVASAGSGAALVANAQIGPIAAGTLGNSPGIYDLLIPNYAGTTFNKIMMANGSRFEPPFQIVIQNYASIWQSTAAITSMKIFVDNGDLLAAGCTFSLYGVL